MTSNLTVDKNKLGVKTIPKTGTGSKNISVIPNAMSVILYTALSTGLAGLAIFLWPMYVDFYSLSEDGIYDNIFPMIWLAAGFITINVIIDSIINRDNKYRFIYKLKNDFTSGKKIGIMILWGTLFALIVVLILDAVNNQNSINQGNQIINVSGLTLCWFVLGLSGILVVPWKLHSKELKEDSVQREIRRNADEVKRKMGRFDE